MAQTRKQKRRRTFAAIGVAALLLALFLYLPQTRQVQLSGTCLEWQNNQPDHTVSRGNSAVFSYPVENREQAVEQLRQLTENVEPAYSWN